REISEIAPVERERIEEDPGDGRRAALGLDVRGPREMHPRLQPLEARTSALVQRDDLAIEDEPVERERAQRHDDLGISRSKPLARAAVELDDMTLARGEHAHAVVLQLE